jgi:hypothetical protein
MISVDARRAEDRLRRFEQRLVALDAAEDALRRHFACHSPPILGLEADRGVRVLDQLVEARRIFVVGPAAECRTEQGESDLDLGVCREAIERRVRRSRV